MKVPKLTARITVQEIIESNTRLRDEADRLMSAANRAADVDTAAEVKFSGHDINAAHNTGRAETLRSGISDLGHVLWRIEGEHCKIASALYRIAHCTGYAEGEGDFWLGPELHKIADALGIADDAWVPGARDDNVILRDPKTGEAIKTTYRAKD